MNIVMITGASSGIGKEFAMQMDAGLHTIDEFWLIARSRERLESLAASMHHKTRIFPMDITDDSLLTQIEDALKENKATIRILINCAGYGLMGSFADLERGGQTGMIRLNCEALTNMTHRMIPYMKRNSRIIQLASSAAFLPQINFAVYAATKSYVLSFSRALNRELKARGITVTSVCPGPVDTPFFDIAEQYGTTLAIKKYTCVTPDKVVKKALRDSLKRKSTSVCSLPIQAFEVLAKLVPHEAILSTTERMK